MSKLIPLRNPHQPTLLETIEEFAGRHQEKTAIRLVGDGSSAKYNSEISYGELNRKMRSVAAGLQQRGKIGDRVLIMAPTCEEYVTGFFGCLTAGMIAVPAYPYVGNRNDIRLQNIVDDCEASLLLSNRPTMRALRSQMTEEQISQTGIDNWVAIEDLSATDPSLLKNVDLGPNDTAFLQYTSGSIGNAKGVMVSHGNIMANSSMLQQAFGTHSGTVWVSWLPLFHDMGLIGGLIQPLYAGGELVLMAPQHFLKRPLFWWQTVSACGGTITGGPNFAYELSIKRVDAESLNDLDLSKLEIAFNGAEPIREATLSRFYEKFKPAQLHEGAQFPCYGLAEATLFVTGGPRLAGYATENRSLGELGLGAKNSDDTGGEKILPSCGEISPLQEVAIVDPESSRSQPQGKVGEVWLSGPNITQGYWGRSATNQEIFNQRLLGKNGYGPAEYMRTGDLGYVRGRHLFITGRLKDLLIINGRNVYPQDIEYSLESIAGLRAGCIAVSHASHSNAANGDVIVMAEVNKDTEQQRLTEISTEIRRLVFHQYEFTPSSVYLLAPGSILKTSSGKIQRQPNARSAASGKIKALDQWHLGGQPEVTTQSTKTAPKKPRKPLGETTKKSSSSSSTDAVKPDEVADAISKWLSQRLPDGVSLDTQQDFADFGLQSVDAMELSQHIQDLFGIELDAAAVFQHSTVVQLAKHCSQQKVV